MVVTLCAQFFCFLSQVDRTITSRNDEVGIIKRILLLSSSLLLLLLLLLFLLLFNISTGASYQLQLPVFHISPA